MLCIKVIIQNKNSLVLWKIQLITKIKKNLVIIPKTFSKTFCGLMKQKQSLLEGDNSVTLVIKQAQHVRKGMPYSQ